MMGYILICYLIEFIAGFIVGALHTFKKSYAYGYEMGIKKGQIMAYEESSKNLEKIKEAIERIKDK